MNNLTISNIHGYMVNVAFASIEKKISRLHLVCAHLLSLKGLAGGGAVQRNTCSILVHISGEAGAVHAGARIASAVFIRSAYKL